MPKRPAKSDFLTPPRETFPITLALQLQLVYCRLANRIPMLTLAINIVPVTLPAIH